MLEHLGGGVFLAVSRFRAALEEELPVLPLASVGCSLDLLLDEAYQPVRDTVFKIGGCDL